MPYNTKILLRSCSNEVHNVGLSVNLTTTLVFCFVWIDHLIETKLHRLYDRCFRVDRSMNRPLIIDLIRVVINGFNFLGTAPAILKYGNRVGNTFCCVFYCVLKLLLINGVKSIVNILKSLPIWRQDFLYRVCSWIRLKVESIRSLSSVCWCKTRVVDISGLRLDPIRSSNATASREVKHHPSPPCSLLSHVVKHRVASLYWYGARCTTPWA